MELIKVNDVYYAYNNEKQAVNGVSFIIEKGSYTTIIGHNGSGKSTLAKLMAGLLPINKGTITINGIEVKEENMPRIREKLGIVFQNPDNQFIGTTVEDDIAFGLENSQIPTEKMPAIIEEYANKVGLVDYLKKEPANLSGGQKQRVAIAGVMAMKPEIIIFDEATSMLDPKGKKEIKQLMYDLSKDNDDITIVSITHDIEEVLQSDDCIVLNNGRLFMHAKPQKVFADPDSLRKIKLDIPFDCKVKEFFKDNKLKLKNDDLKGMVDELWQYASNH